MLAHFRVLMRDLRLAQYFTYNVIFSYDYLKISNENNYIFGVFCGERTGETVLVTGDYAVMTFYSDYMTQKRGFLISFATVPHGKYIRLDLLASCKYVLLL